MTFLQWRRPCEVNDGEPCKQCNRRVTGKHVNAVQTRSKWRRKQLEPASPAGEVAADQSRASTPISGAEPDNKRGGPNATAARSTRPQVPRKGKGPRVNRGTGLIHRTAPNAAARQVGQWSPEFLAKCQQDDADIGPAIKWANEGTRPTWEEVRPASPMLRSLWQQYESLVLIDGVLHRIFHYADGSAKYYQLVLPAVLMADFLEMIHADAAGHLKFNKCLEHVRSRAWWPRFRQDLKMFIQCCVKCAAYHRGKTPKQAQLHPMLLGAPAERWVVDLCGPYSQSQGYKYIFTAICPFSKYIITAPIRNKEASTVARVIFEQIILKWGLMS